MDAIYAEATARTLSRAQEAKIYLLDYRPPGAEVSRLEWLRLCELCRDGWSPADAAERVQAESC